MVLTLYMEIGKLIVVRELKQGMSCYIGMRQGKGVGVVNEEERKKKDEKKKRNTNPELMNFHRKTIS